MLESGALQAGLEDCPSVADSRAQALLGEPGDQLVEPGVVLDQAHVLGRGERRELAPWARSG